MNKEYSIINNHGVYVALNQHFLSAAPPQTAEQLKNLNNAQIPRNTTGYFCPAIPNIGVI